MSVFGRASNQTPLNSDKERDIGGGGVSSLIVYCMTVLASMAVSGQQYGLAAEKLVQGKYWRTFFLLSPPERQLEWVNGLSDMFGNFSG